MPHSRRHLLQTLAAWTAAGLGPSALARPAKPLRILLGFPPGGATHGVARLLQEGLSARLGQPVQLDIRPGAGGMNAALALKSAVPDGHTLLFSHDHTISIVPLLAPQFGFSPEQDVAPVAGIGHFANGLALAANTPAHSWREYLYWLRSEHDSHGVIGVPAALSVPNFLVRWMGKQFGLELEVVPYRGGAPLLSDLAGGLLAAGLGSVPDFIEAQRAGKIRFIAVQGGPRQAALPGVPTLTELGIPTVASMPFYGFYAPHGTSSATLAPFTRALAQLLQDSEVHTRLSARGLNVQFMSAAQLRALERAHRKAWRTIIELHRP